LVKVEVYPDYSVPRVKFFLCDTADTVGIECVCRRHGARLVYVWAYVDWRRKQKGEARNLLVAELLKAALRKVEPHVGTGIIDLDFNDRWPTLFEFMTVSSYEEAGKRVERRTATLNVFTQDGMWKVFLNDRETQRCMCVASRTHRDLLDALEAALTSDEPPWRAIDPTGSTTRQGAKRPRS